jgi:replicative DNA helicase
MKVMSEAASQGGKTLVDFLVLLPEPLPGSVEVLIRMVREDTARRRWTANLTRAMAAIGKPESDVQEVVSALAAEMEADSPAALTAVPRLTFDEVMSIDDTARPFVIPHTLREGEVMLMTGEEGSGKSMLMSQIGLGAAMGVNTLSLSDETHTPVRVLVIDVENEDIQIRDNMRRIWPYMHDRAPGVHPDIEFTGHKFADLTNLRDKRKVINEAIDYGPNLIIMGTVYKLAPTTDHEEAFNAVMTTVRSITSKTGAAFIIEHHAGNGFQGDREGFRPYGSSMWRRWPNFGVGLVRRKDDKKVAELVRWRGERARGRVWPAGVRETAYMPWSPISEDEWSTF